MPLAPKREDVARFSKRLDQLATGGARLGVAVSGGPDSLALLLLAAAARPGGVEAATIDHGLRPENAAEAAEVERLCERLEVPHRTMAAQWDKPPETAIQERARAERYRLLGGWVGERGLAALATAHHLDDQAETFLMRLSRGAGVRGLGAIRPVARIPGSRHRLIRPLLAWSRSELAAICEAAAVEPVDDPANQDEQFERVRIRKALAAGGLLDPRAIARSAANLASADLALDWAAARHWEQSVTGSGQDWVYRPGNAPHEIRRRIIGRAIAMIGTEGAGAPIRGREIDQLVEVLGSGGTATLRGVRCSGGEAWTFAPAPPRRGA